ncbi:Cell number regulator 6 [Sesamum alatum]|uniref:Cell number regulator 6 n=1 Tax=Sesamum alatum TaxID=300844 RepID=A0AAE2CA41_9LAMI|nr:Cell number regulator 6 [Sesamum alatum]
MAEGQYVKLTKNQNSSENITPGELNQPIDVPALNCPRCEECGQPLPASYLPPADEEWATGIFGCADDQESCFIGLFCPCILFGRNVANLNEEISQQNACVGHAVCVEGGIALAAATAAFHGIDPDTACLVTEGLLFAWWDSPCDPCLVHCCLHWCAICQEHRERHYHLSECSASSPTAVSPPAVQEMNAAQSQETASSSQPADGHNNLQLQPVNIS